VKEMAAQSPKAAPQRRLLTANFGAREK
jgi:hypothetical protein